jgi:bacteriocin-like protein
MIRELTETEMSQVSGGFSLPARFEFGVSRPVININICDLIPDLALCSDTLDGLLGGHIPTTPPPTQNSVPITPSDPLTPVQALPDVTPQPSPATPDLPDFDFSGLFGREGGRLIIFNIGGF